MVGYHSYQVQGPGLVAAAGPLHLLADQLPRLVPAPGVGHLHLLGPAHLHTDCESRIYSASVLLFHLLYLSWLSADLGGGGRAHLAGGDHLHAVAAGGRQRARARRGAVRGHGALAHLHTEIG